VARIKELEDDAQKEYTDATQVADLIHSSGWEILRKQILTWIEEDRVARDSAPREPIFYELRGKQKRAQQILDFVESCRTLEEAYREETDGE